MHKNEDLDCKVLSVITLLRRGYSSSSEGYLSSSREMCYDEAFKYLEIFFFWN